MESHTQGMKIAVSISDELFKGAERLAARNKKSRSQLYSEALREYVGRHAPDEVTEAMNRACDQLGSESRDPFVTVAAARIIEASEW